MTVTLGNAVSDYFKRYATFTGRSTRSQYWFVMLALFLVNVFITLPGIMVMALGWSFPLVGMGLAVCMNIIGTLLFLGLLLPTLALTVRRLHDIGRGGGWLALFFLAPLVAGVMFGLAFAESRPNYFLLFVSGLIVPVCCIWGFIWMCTPGDAGPNEYGADILELPDPRAQQPCGPYMAQNQWPAQYPQNPYPQNNYPQNQYPKHNYPQNPYGNPYNTNPYGANPYSEPGGNGSEGGGAPAPGQFQQRRPGQFGGGLQ